MKTLSQIVSFVLFLLIPASLSAQLKDCSNTSVDLTPLNDLGTDTYLGIMGGLYPGGRNDRPLAHELEGVELSREIVPLDQDGNVDPVNGKIVFMSVGMSGTFSEFEWFIQETSAIPELNPNLVLFNGAQPGVPLEQMANPHDSYWSNLDARLDHEGIDPKQVQVVWFKEAYHKPASSDFIENTRFMAIDFARVVMIIKRNFPNVLLVYCSSLIYGGYTTNELRNEPQAYETGFGNQLLIQAQIEGHPALNYDPENGPVRAPWLSWGPYLWADGLVPRSDGLKWACDDFEDDGFHPAEGARIKVSSALIEFFTTDPTATEWFLDFGIAEEYNYNF